MLGIEPRESESKGAQYYPIKSVFDSTRYYISYFSENHFGEKKHPEPNIKFLFNKLLILTTYPSTDPKSKILILGEIDDIDDNEYSYRRLQCKDNAGNYVAVAICYEHSTQVESIILVYSNTTYYYEVNKTPIPPVVMEIIYNPESRTKFLNDIDMPNIGYGVQNNFFNQFGVIEKVVKLIGNEQHGTIY